MGLGETTPVRNFRFVENGRIALSAVPETPASVDWLREQGIRAVVSLHPVPEASVARMSEHGIRWLPYVVSDVAAGVPGPLEPVFQAMDEQLQRQPSVLIHCLGGGGRSATLYAAYLVYQGLSASQALLRSPGVEKETQRAFLHGYAAAFRG